jgi:hypothetical protein
MDSGESGMLNGVWGSSGSDVFVVGWPDDSGPWPVYDPTILHYDGTSWSAMSWSGHLNGVWGSSGSDVFAVGTGGGILHYDGSDWKLMNIGTTHGLGGVWGSSGSDVFAVGDYGTILHYGGERHLVYLPLILKNPPYPGWPP